MSTSTTTASPAQNVQAWTKLHAERYFDVHPRYKERLHTLGLDRITGMLQPRPDDVLLDIGCGYGRLLWHLLPRVGRAVGIDLAEPPLTEARRILAGRGDFEIIQGDGLTFGGVTDGSVTGAYSFTVLQHMTRDGVRGYLREIQRVLAPGGRACLQYFDDGTAERDILDNGREQSISYSTTQVCETVEQAGLRVERLDRESLETLYPGSGLSWLWVLATKSGRAA